MKKEYNAPGIYIEENALLPKSVVQVETAIPAFIGFSEKALFKGQDFHEKHIRQPLEINSFTEFELIFGGPPDPASVEIELDGNNNVLKINIVELCYLYYSVRLFFENGGSSCLIVSVGNYDSAGSNAMKSLLLEGLSSLEKTDAPTLLLVPDAVKLTYAGAGEVHAAMLAQSYKLADRFALIDFAGGDTGINDREQPLENFRNHLGSEHLSYGAAYYPWLVTSWPRKITGNTVLGAKYIRQGSAVENQESLFSKEAVDVLKCCRFFEHERRKLKLPDALSTEEESNLAAFVDGLYRYFYVFYNLINTEITRANNNPVSKTADSYAAKGSVLHSMLKKFQMMVLSHHPPIQAGNFSEDFSPLTFPSQRVFSRLRNRITRRPSMMDYQSLAEAAEKLVNRFYQDLERVRTDMLRYLEYTEELYKSAVKAIREQNLAVPPGGAVAGVFTTIDRTHGVWKAPANVSFASVIRPAVDISHHEMERMNAGAVAGKPVNAIRSFIGEGALLWGARTLAGNSNELRYINVRRFSIMVEQSVREAIRPFSFEPNTEAIWLRVKQLTENFLYSLWQQGALAGSKPQQAYFVKTGLGYTMTAADIENGLMILDIGMAVVKPAEFILVRIAQKMQLSREL